MNGHPGGDADTLKMLALSSLQKGAKILDMGAGAGETVALLTELGYEAEGIDLAPRAEVVKQGDFLHSGYPVESFDGIISQCAFTVSGNSSAALKESARLLKKGGVLMLSDICFQKPEELCRSIENAGFTILYTQDLSKQWRKYYIEAIWRGTAECLNHPGKCSYHMLICRKE